MPIYLFAYLPTYDLCTGACKSTSITINHSKQTIASQGVHVALSARYVDPHNIILGGSKKSHTKIQI